MMGRVNRSRIIGSMDARFINSSLVCAALMLALLTACASGPRQVRGELPLVALDGLERQGDRITLLLGLRNINDSALPLTEVEVRLRIDGVSLITVAYAPNFESGPRGREVLTLRGTGEPAGLELLDRFDPNIGTESGHQVLTSIAWTMEVDLGDERGRTRTAEASGFLHPVPGQPGRFR